MTQRAVLCPRCRRLIGSDESVCSWCGTSRTAPWWQLLSWSRGALGGEGLVKAIITANIIWYAVSLIYSRGSAGGGVLGLLAPDKTSLLVLGATGTVPIDHFGRVWTLLSANYLHGGIFHIIFNMMAMRQIAPWVSSEFGPSRMFTIYTLGGVFGFWVSYLAGVAFTIGASAGVCSLIGALLYFGKSRGGAYGNSVYREVSGWVISLAIFGLIIPGINNWGHGGGVVAGIILGRLLGYDQRRAESAAYRAIAVLCAVATIAVLGWALVGAFF
ncbi:rhomboid family intramembrane serine protease [Geobacter sp. SVR]|uniref:rhomboid family intramembrane serine protease n=1 Tax=Geobacter sp. SVR TaxID=2495594 RepID=UPI00143EF6BB|nr:rhomboid family intramembrane serine protease [Geobacter sp. SVR]BCS53114.1 rhomboid family intramembrane serine protease [Geobacter sp. SVR]GCF84499.1 rhomboid family intramembrane serine protease [Geobacter sp. SVR]